MLSDISHFFMLTGSPCRACSICLSRPPTLCRGHSTTWPRTPPSSGGCTTRSPQYALMGGRRPWTTWVPCPTWRPSSKRRYGEWRGAVGFESRHAAGGATDSDPKKGNNVIDSVLAYHDMPHWKTTHSRNVLERNAQWKERSFFFYLESFFPSPSEIIPTLFLVWLWPNVARIPFLLASWKANFCIVIMTLTGILCVFLDHCHVSPPTSLYPVVPGNARFITDKEVVLGNYWFPKKVG